MRLGTGTYGTDSTASPTHSFHRQGQRARHVTPLAMAGQFPTLAITKQSIDVEGIVVSLVYVSEISFYPSLASQIRK